MTVRTRYRVEIKISSTSAEEADLANIKTEVVTDDFGEGGSRKWTLAAGAVDVPIALGNVLTTRFLSIRTNSKDPNLLPVAISVKFGTILDPAFTIEPMPSTKEGHFLWSTSGVSAMFASNPGATDMDLTVANAGD